MAQNYTSTYKMTFYLDKNYTKNPWNISHIFKKKLILTLKLSTLDLNLRLFVSINFMTITKLLKDLPLVNIKQNHNGLGNKNFGDIRF